MNTTSSSILDGFGFGPRTPAPELPVSARHDATAVLWKEDTPLGGALSRDPDWEIVHRDAPWVVAVPARAR